MTRLDEKTRLIAMFVSSVLLKAFVLGVCLLGVSSISVLFLTDQIYSVHNGLMEIPRPEYNALLFNWLGNMKLLLIVLLLLPSISIRWALKTS